MNLKGFRKDLGMTQEQFAEHFGLSVRTLQNWEQDRYSCPVFAWSMILKIYDLENRLEKWEKQ